MFTNKIKNLVISAGGVMIISYLGVLRFLDEKNIITNIQSYYGVSAGAILSLMLTLKYSIDEIEKFLFSFDFQKLLSDFDIDNFINNLSLSNGKNAEIVIKSVIIYKLGDNYDNITFIDLFNKTNIELNVYAMCCEENTMHEFNHLKTPDIPIWKAIAASSRIPIVYSPIKINNLTFVDGAVINKYPIQLIPKEKLPATLGILCECQQINNSTFDNQNLNNLLNIIYHIIDIDYIIYSPYNLQTIHIIIPSEVNINPIDFDLSIEQKKILFDIGYQAAKNQISKLIPNNFRCDCQCHNKIKRRYTSEF